MARQPSPIPGQEHRSSDELIQAAADLLQDPSGVGDLQRAQDLISQVLEREANETNVAIFTRHR